MVTNRARINKIDEARYGIAIPCTCGRTYDALPRACVQCPYCSHIWNLRPDVGACDPSKVALGKARPVAVPDTSRSPVLEKLQSLSDKK